MQESVAELEIEFALLPSAAQKRSDYRPNHKHPLTGEFFLGQVTFHDGFVDPGTTVLAFVRLLGYDEHIDSLIRFGSWTIWEGATHVGSARIIGWGANNSFKPTPLRGAA